MALCSLVWESALIKFRKPKSDQKYPPLYLSFHPQSARYLLTFCSAPSGTKSWSGSNGLISRATPDILSFVRSWCSLRGQNVLQSVVNWINSPTAKSVAMSLYDNITFRFRLQQAGRCCVTLWHQQYQLRKCCVPEGTRTPHALNSAAQTATGTKWKEEKRDALRDRGDYWGHTWQLDE